MYCTGFPKHCLAQVNPITGYSIFISRETLYLFQKKLEIETSRNKKWKRLIQEQSSIVCTNLREDHRSVIFTAIKNVTIIVHSNDESDESGTVVIKIRQLRGSFSYRTYKVWQKNSRHTYGVTSIRSKGIYVP